MLLGVSELKAWGSVHPLIAGPELITINQHCALVAFTLKAAGDHFHRIADLDMMLTQVGQLGGYQGTFFLLGQLDFTHPGGFHFPLLNERSCPFAVSLRSLAARLATGEALEQVMLIEGAFLPINLSIAEGAIHRLRIGHRLNAKSYPG